MNCVGCVPDVIKNYVGSVQGQLINPKELIGNAYRYPLGDLVVADMYPTQITYNRASPGPRP